MISLTFAYSIIEKLNSDQLNILDEFVGQIHNQKILNEIEKMMFDRAQKARFLVGNGFDVKKAVEHFKEYVTWRRTSKIDNLFVRSFIKLRSCI